jgi:pantetheine-phosphate adenylyltransferase
MNIGFYPGSFSPFTNGHLHVVKTASKLFDKVIIGIGINQEKTSRYDNEGMRDAIEKTIRKEGLDNVSVITYSNLSVDAARECNATMLIRGIRNGTDYEYEEKIALINEDLADIDTIYIRAGVLGNISSSLVVELFKNGRDVSKYIPVDVLEYIKDK